MTNAPPPVNISSVYPTTAKRCGGVIAIAFFLPFSSIAPLFHVHLATHAVYHSHCHLGAEEGASEQWAEEEGHHGEGLSVFVVEMRGGFVPGSPFYSCLALESDNELTATDQRRRHRSELVHFPNAPPDFSSHPLRAPPRRT